MALDAWDVYVSLAESADRDLTDSWEKGIDVLLVYAALFSSVLASFLSQPSPPSLWVNALWFASLVCSLSASFFAMLARQWIQEYKRWMSSHPDDLHARARLRHFRHLGLQRWRVSTIIWTLPFVLHVSLLLFFAGLVLYSALAHPLLALVSGLLVALTLTFYVVTLALPLFFVQCPFQTPPIRSLQNISGRLYQSLLRAILCLPCPSSIQHTLQQHLARHTRLAQDGGKEASAIAHSKDALDAQVLASLISTSWDTSDKIIATAITTLDSTTTNCAAARDILRASDAARLIEKQYLGLLRLGNEFPHLSIAPGRENDAYTYLRALLHLCEHKAVPRDWQPSNRLRHSLHACKQTDDRNMRSIVLALIDALGDAQSAYGQV